MIVKTIGQKGRLSIPTVIPGTSTGLRISAVDLAAFLDNDVAIAQYADGRSRIRIYDASLRYCEAILGSVGTGETYGTNFFTTLDFTVGWTGSGTAVDADSFSSAAVGGLEKTNLLTAYALYKCALNASTTASGCALKNTSSSATYATSIGADAKYTTCLSTNLGLYFRNDSAGQTDVNKGTSLLYTVLTPTSNGCTLKNAAGAQSFISKDANFTYNAASYTYKIFTNRRIVNPRSIMGVNTFRN
jgi:hypothetical protein